MTTLLIGHAPQLLRDHHHPPRSVLLVETPQTIARRGLYRAPADHAAVAAVVPVRRLETETVLSALTAFAPDAAVDRVVPGTEAGVLAAAGVARFLSLPGAGLRAATVFRDKIALRETAVEAGLCQPAWAEVTPATDLRAVCAELGGGGFVLKPAAAAGGVGVTYFDPAGEPAAAWHETTTAVPPGNGRRRTRYLVEQRLTGAGVSVQCLVHDGEIVFTAVTDRHRQPGGHPAEIGHQVPGPRGSAQRDRLTTSMRRLVEAAGLAYGILHGDWILTDQGPALLGCAARIPGDRIMELLELAYESPLTAHYLELMAGNRPTPPRDATRGAAIRYLTADPGTVREVIGATDAGGLAGVHGLVVDATYGRRIGPTRPAGNRVGYVVTTGPGADDAWDLAGQAAGLVKIAVR
ncbi:biotin carboxylase [Polymorphospora sp. NPDC050346]|uniref:ATP-grasp domain-containing protein n=1 Tax=Polymorphospora sp. NPDC050346 TaxID=3155780 RepID=UPI0033CD3EEF